MTARCVANLSAQKIGVIYTNDDAGKDMLNGAQMKAQELGVELVSQQVVAGTADASAPSPPSRARVWMPLSWQRSRPPCPP